MARAMISLQKLSFLHGSVTVIITVDIQASSSDNKRKKRLNVSPMVEFVLFCFGPREL